jgi:N-methylhydantoinase A
MPGALSAIGILLADAVRDYSRTVMLPAEATETIESIFVELEQRGVAEWAAEGLQGLAERTVDIRYRRQGYELNVPYHAQSIQSFHRLHQQRYGFSDERKPVEVVNLRLRMVATAPPYSPAYREPVPGDGAAACYAERPIHFAGRWVSGRHYRRQSLVPGDALHGPAMITEYTSATALPPGCCARVDGFGNLVISVEEGA